MSWSKMGSSRGQAVESNLTVNVGVFGEVLSLDDRQALRPSFRRGLSPRFLRLPHPVRRSSRGLWLRAGLENPGGRKGNALLR